MQLISTHAVPGYIYNMLNTWIKICHFLYVTPKLHSKKRNEVAIHLKYNGKLDMQWMQLV